MSLYLIYKTTENRILHKGSKICITNKILTRKVTTRGHLLILNFWKCISKLSLGILLKTKVNKKEYSWEDFQNELLALSEWVLIISWEIAPTFISILRAYSFSPKTTKTAKIIYTIFWIFHKTSVYVFLSNFTN